VKFRGSLIGSRKTETFVCEKLLAKHKIMPQNARRSGFKVSFSKVNDKIGFYYSEEEILKLLRRPRAPDLQVFR
jgi:hypothetical protein